MSDNQTTQEETGYLPLSHAIKKEKVPTNWGAVFDESIGNCLKDASKEKNLADMAEKVFIGLFFAGILFPIKALEEILKAQNESVKKTKKAYHDSLEAGLKQGSFTKVALAGELIRQTATALRNITDMKNLNTPKNQTIADFVRTLPKAANGMLDIGGFSKSQRSKFSSYMLKHGLYSMRYHKALAQAAGIEWTQKEKRSIISLAISMMMRATQNQSALDMVKKRCAAEKNGALTRA